MFKPPGVWHIVFHSFTHPFFWFQPGVGVLYCVPESKEPGLSQTNSATHQVKQVFTFPLHLRKTVSDKES